MAKWHINGSGEVGRCTATKRRCPFGGASGEENHFSSREKAEEAAAARFETYSTLGGTTKKQRNDSFAPIRDDVQKALVAYGVKKNSELPEVRNVGDMVDRWFDGDSKRYSDFKRLLEDNKLNAGTKRSIAQLIGKGVSVKAVGDVNNPSDSGTTVDLLGDSLQGVSLEQIRAGRPF